MLTILEISEQSFDVTVETDDYVPLSVVTYDRPIGAMFYRLGNFDTSLIEITVDPESGALRGFTVVSVDKKFEGQVNAGRVVSGVPITDIRAFSQNNVIDDPTTFSLGLRDSAAIVAMNDFENADTIVACGDLKFYLYLSTLVGLVVENLSGHDMLGISGHISRI